MLNIAKISIQVIIFILQRGFDLNEIFVANKSGRGAGLLQAFIAYKCKV